MAMVFGSGSKSSDLGHQLLLARKGEVGYGFGLRPDDKFGAQPESVEARAFVHLREQPRPEGAIPRCCKLKKRYGNDRVDQPALLLKGRAN